MEKRTFNELNLSPQILRAITEEGYKTATPIQAEAIPHILSGSDLIGCAQTGTGKTAAFALPILQRLSASRKRPQAGTARALVLTPTRELAAQIGENFRNYGRHLGLNCALVFGGVSQKPQVKALSKGVDILVATPGRLLDLMCQRHVNLSKIEIFVLDEADRMLDMGFLPDIRKVIATLPRDRQSLLFSATMSQTIMKLTETILTDPVKITLAQPESTIESIDERVLFVDESDKRSLLTEVLKAPETKRTLVFTRTKHGADRLVKHLGQEAVKARAIHGNKSQNARTAALDDFRTGRCHILVATDIAARGIDVDRISHVINYDMPNEPESYVHRIGRTARAGAVGTAISFCGRSERLYLRNIERLLKRTVPVFNDHPYHSESIASAEVSSNRFSTKGKFRFIGRPRKFRSH